MAGRKRGGGASSKFNLQQFGLTKADVSISTVEPPPAFPALRTTPLPLQTGDAYDYMLALKQDFRENMQASPHYIPKAAAARPLQRYSDKLKHKGNSDSLSWTPNWKRLPTELKMNVRKRVKLSLTHRVGESVSLVTGEPGAEAVGSDDEADDKDNELDEPLEEDDDEEDGDDYGANYFDNGESYLDESDDVLEEGAVF